MKAFFCLAPLAVLLSGALPPRPAIAEYVKPHHIELRFAPGLPLELFERTRIVVKGKALVPERRYDTATSSVLLYWRKVPHGTCTLDLQTVFLDRRTHTLVLNSDTSLNIADALEGQQLAPLPASALAREDSIEIRFNSIGCFGGYGHGAVLYPTAGTSWNARYTYDSTVYETNDRGKMARRIKVERLQPIPAAVADSLVHLMQASIALQESALQNGKACWSTTHETLLIRAGKRVFGFKNNPVCDWQLFHRFWEHHFDSEGYR